MIPAAWSVGLAGTNTIWRVMQVDSQLPPLSCVGLGPARLPATHWVRPAVSSGEEYLVTT